MDTYTDDLAALIETLDLKNATLVGHSTGGGEVARYIGRHASKRVSQAVLIASVPPLMLKTKNIPEACQSLSLTKSALESSRTAPSSLRI